jgi:hypothetical protein
VCSDSRVVSLASEGSVGQISTLREGLGKVAVNGKYLLGAAGDVRAINILHHAFTPPQPPVGIKGKKLDHFFTAKFIPVLRECFEHQGYATPDKDDKHHIAEHESEVIVVLAGTIYIVDGDYSWYADSSSMYALGSGSAYALGAMCALAGSKKINNITVNQAKAMCMRALNVASKHDPQTGPPFHTFVQESRHK